MRKLKPQWLFVGGGVVALAGPMMLVTACGPSSSTPSTTNQIEIKATDLSKVTVTGDSAHPVFTIPKELNYVDKDNKLSATGTTKAFDIYARTTLKNDAKPDSINNTFMPPELLTAYLSAQLTWESGKLIMTKDGTKIDVLSKYSSIFGFTESNYEIIYAGEVPTASYELQYVQLNNNLTAPEGQIGVSIKPDTTQLTSYVNLNAADWDAIKTTLAAKFAYEPTSDHANVVWTASLALSDLPTSWVSSGVIESMQYTLTPNAPGAVYTNTIPTAFPYEVSNRQLGIHLKPKPGKTLAFADFDVTEFSKVKNLLTLVDAFDGYSAMNFNKINLNVVSSLAGDDFELTGVESYAVSGTQIWYQIGTNATKFTSQNLLKEIRTTKPATNLNIYALFETNDATLFKVVDNRRGLIVNKFNGFVDTKPFFDMADLLTVDLAVSTPSALVYKSQPTLPTELTASIEKVEYLLGDYQTTAAAQAAQSWSTTLPTSVANTTNAHLFVRLVTKTGYIYSQKIADLTQTSGVNKITSVADTAALETQLNETVITATSTNVSATFDKVVTLTTEQLATFDRIEYLSGDFETLSAAENANSGLWMATLPTTLDFTATKRYLWARVVLKPNYRAEKTYFNITTTSRVQTVLSSIDALPLHAQLDLTKVEIKGSLISTLVDEASVTLPVGTSLEYKINPQTDYINGDALKAYLELNVATVTQEDISSIRVRLKNLDSTLYILTNNKEATPKTTEFLLRISAAVLPETIQALKDITYEALSQSNNILWTTLPVIAMPIANIEYLSGNYADATAVAAASASAWSLTLPTSVDVDYTTRHLWARLNPMPGYVLTGTTLVDLTASSKVVDLRIDVTVRHQALLVAVSGVEVAATSNHDAVTWTNNDFSTYTEFTLEFLYSTTVKTVAEAMTTTSGWATTLPSKVDAVAGDRYLFSRITLKQGYVSSEATLYADLTLKISTIKTIVDVFAGFDAIDLSKIKVTGWYIDLTVDETDVTPSAHVSVKYSFGTDTLKTLYTKAELIAYFITNVTTIPATTVAALQAQLVVENASLYTISNDKKVTLNTAQVRPIKDYIVTTLVTDLEAIVLSTEGQSVDDLNWNNVLTEVAEPTSKVLYYYGTEATATEVQLVNESNWLETLPLALSGSAIDDITKLHFWAKIVPLVGYAPSVQFVDLTTTSLIQTVLKPIPAELLDSTFAQSILSGMFTNGTPSTNYNTNITYVALDSKFTQYVIVEVFSFNPFTEGVLTLEDADANGTWVEADENSIPATLPPSSEERPWFYIRMRNRDGYKPFKELYDLFDVTFTNVPYDIPGSPEYAVLDLSKVVAQFTGSAGPLSFDLSAASSLPQGTDLEYSYRQVDGADEWVNKQTLETVSSDLTFRTLYTTVKVRLFTDWSNVILDDADKKVTTLTIQNNFVVSTQWTYELVMYDADNSANAVGVFRFYDKSFNELTTSNIVSWVHPPTGPYTQRNFAAMYGGAFGLPVKTVLRWNFTTNRQIKYFGSRVLDPSTAAKANLDIDLSLSYPGDPLPNISNSYITSRGNNDTSTTTFNLVYDSGSVPTQTAFYVFRT